MKKWGVIVSTFYALLLLFILTPAAQYLSSPDHSLKDLSRLYSESSTWLMVGSLLAGQVILLFVSVDTSFRKLRPRMHVAVSIVISAMLFAFLSLGVFWSIGAAWVPDQIFDLPLMHTPVLMMLLFWLIWGVLFYLYSRKTSQFVSTMISWLLRGSILELLIAVPCHLIVRHRKDCSAPVLTSFGITTGIAIMLLSFGPSVLLLYKKRMDEYSRSKREMKPDNSSINLP